MSEDQAYHERRAATQRALAARCTDPVVEQAHLELVKLHEERARRERPTLRMVM